MSILPDKWSGKETGKLINIEEALNVIYPVDIIAFKGLKDDPQFESDWAAISTASLPLVFGDESEGICDS